MRFGDPEPSRCCCLHSDLVDLVDAAIDGKLDRIDAHWDPRPSLGVVMASAPYPDTPVTGDVISGLDAVPADAKVFRRHRAGCAWPRSSPPAGACYCACALGDSVADAQQRGFAGVAAIHWTHEFHRRDIGWRAIAGNAARG